MTAAPTADEGVENLRRRVEDLRRLHDLARIAASPLEAEAMLHLAVEKILTMLRSEVACLLLREGERGLVERVAWGLDQAALRQAGGRRDPIERVVLDDAGFVLRDAEGPRVSLVSGREVHLRGLLGVPLRQAGRPLGALFVGNPERPYDEEDLRLLEAAADILALAVVTARRFGRAAAEVEELAVLVDLGRLVAAADPERAGTYVAHAAEALLSLDRFAVFRLAGDRPETIAGGRIDPDEVGRRLSAAVEADLERRDLLPFRPHLVDADGARRSVYLAPVGSPGGLCVLLGIGAAVEAEEYDRRIRLLHLIAAHGAALVRAVPVHPAAAAGRAPDAAGGRPLDIDEFVAGIAHEVKNPLTSIKGFAELLPARKGDAAFLDKFGEIVLSEVARLERLVGDLLALARPRAAAPRPVALRRLLDGLAELLTPEARALGIEIEVDAPEGLAVRADGDSLRRAVLNLARNAVEAMRETGGRLTLQARREAGEEGEEDDVAPRILLEVSDTGPGVPPDVRARLFSPFVSGRPGGTGLGLAICARIVEAAGGTIEARSVPGVGATFAVRLMAA